MHCTLCMGTGTQVDGLRDGVEWPAKLVLTPRRRRRRRVPILETAGSSTLLYLASLHHLHAKIRELCVLTLVDLDARRELIWRMPFRLSQVQVTTLRSNMHA